MEIRYLKDLEKVVYDKEWFRSSPNLELYYMFRGEDQKGELRYDVTVLNEGPLGKEYLKTKGHKHKQNIGELYTVLEGKAFFLMQKENGEVVEDVYAVLTKKNESVIIPSSYSHITYNASLNEKLKMANWVSQECDNEYSFLEEMEGACYYYTLKGWVKNKNYKKISKLRFERPLKKMPENLDFLKYGKS